MTAPVRFRDVFQTWTPWWLSERPGQAAGLTIGYRVLWMLHATIDKLAEAMVNAFASAFPGYFADTSNLELIGRSRGLLRGKDDTDSDFAARLRRWRSTWVEAGTRVGLAKRLHEYLAGRPIVDVVNRAGMWTRCNADGSITQYRSVAWNWDGTSNPERAGDWSDLWIIVQGTGGFSFRLTNTAVLNSFTTAQRTNMLLGHSTGTQSDVDDVKAILSQWKSAASRIRCVIWNNQAGAFDPTTPSSLPDGTWGEWFTKAGDGGYVKNAGRTSGAFRFWEPN